MAYDALQPWVDPTNYFSVAFMEEITNITNPTDDEFRSAVKQIYADNNIKVMASCFGSFDYPTKSTDPNALGLKIAQFVKEMQFDGVDIDWEDTNSFDSQCTGEYWLTNLTLTLRENLPSPYIITHAPQAPYFMGTKLYPCGAYLYVNQNAGNAINWYNIQFYNQASSSYDTYNSLFIQSNGWATNTSVCEMINGANNLNVKIPQNKVCIGKPVTTGDASNTGYVSASNLKAYFTEATSNNPNCVWKGCFMDWEFSSDINENFAYINTIATVWQ